MSGRLRASLVLAVLLIGIGFRLPALWAGFAMDDYAQIAMLDGVYPVERSPLDLFSFSSGDPREVQNLVDRGSLAWWSNPELRLSALRPLSSALTWVDGQVFGREPLLHHAHSFLWWVALILMAARLFSTIVPLRIAGLALVLYALDECHGFPLAWLANRNSIVSALFGMLALWGHVRWREHGSRAGLLTSIVGFAFALAGGEYALAVVPYFFAYELIAGPGDRGTRTRALVPLVIVVMAYVALHRGLGYGSFGSGIYLDPVNEPIAYLRGAALRIPMMLADMLLGIPTAHLAYDPVRQRVQAWIGVVGVIVVLALLRGVLRRSEPDTKKRLMWLLLGSVLSLIPVVSSFVSARLLIVPAIGGHVIIAAILLDGFDTVRERGGWGRKLATAYLALAHLALPLWWGNEELRGVNELNRGASAAVLESEIDDREVAGQRLVVLSGIDPMTLLYPPMIRYVHGSPLPRSWWVLSLVPLPHALTRTSRDTFELEVMGGSMLAGPTEQLFRRPEHPLAQGQVVELDGLTISVLELGDTGPRRVRYQFEHSLDDSRLAFFVTTADGFRRYPMPPVGPTVRIPPPTFPLKKD